MKLKLLAAVLCLLPVRTVLADTTVTVKAEAHSSIGSGLDTGLTLRAGDRVSIAATGTWSLGSDSPHPRTSDADGLTEQYVNYEQGGLSAPYGALVGRTGDGKLFLIGKSYDGIVDAGPLRLYCFDENASDNVGQVTVKIEVFSVEDLKQRARTPEELAQILVAEADPRSSNVQPNPFTAPSAEVNEHYRKWKTHELPPQSWKTLIDGFFYENDARNHHLWRKFHNYVSEKAISRAQAKDMRVIEKAFKEHFFVPDEVWRALVGSYHRGLLYRDSVEEGYREDFLGFAIDRLLFTSLHEQLSEKSQERLALLLPPKEPRLEVRAWRKGDEKLNCSWSQMFRLLLHTDPAFKAMYIKASMNTVGGFEAVGLGPIAGAVAMIPKGNAGAAVIWQRLNTAVRIAIEDCKKKNG